MQSVIYPLQFIHSVCVTQMNLSAGSCSSLHGARRLMFISEQLLALYIFWKQNPKNHRMNENGLDCEFRSTNKYSMHRKQSPEASKTTQRQRSNKRDHKSHMLLGMSIAVLAFTLTMLEPSWSCLGTLVLSWGRLVPSRGHAFRNTT